MVYTTQYLLKPHCLVQSDLQLRAPAPHPQPARVWQVRHQPWNLPCLSPGFFSTPDLHPPKASRDSATAALCKLPRAPKSTSSKSFLVGVEKAKIAKSNYTVSEVLRSVYLSNISRSFLPHAVPHRHRHYFLSKFNAIKPDCDYGIAPAVKNLIQEGKRGPSSTQWIPEAPNKHVFFRDLGEVSA